MAGELAELKNREREIMNELAENRAAQSEINKANYIKNTGLFIGADVKIKKGLRGVITNIISGNYITYSIVTLYNKNMVLGNKDIKVYENDFIKLI